MTLSLYPDDRYSPEDVRTVLNMCEDNLTITKRKSKKTVQYYNAPMAFDIEVSSFYDHGEKRACMYVWQLGICGHVIVGRTWEQFITCMQELEDALSTCSDLRVIIWVHNLAYEFQFIRKLFTWDKVFSIRNRTPVYALTDSGIEFRCSYILSGYSLEKLGGQLLHHDIRKLSGALDYSKIRHSETPLTKREIQYAVNDVLVVMAYIQEKIDTDGSIDRLPLTKTGYVRNYCRKHCYHTEGVSSKKDVQFLRYREIMQGLTLEPEEYKQLKRAFSGGFTHASAFYSGTEVKDVTSYDFTSSYPYVMISEQFPMSACTQVTITSNEQFYKYLQCYCCLFDLDLYGVTDSFIYEHYISSSKCYVQEGAKRDNGRIVSADHIALTVTEQDYMIIAKTYDWERATVSNFRIYNKGYLPTVLVRSIIEFYRDKTTLKGVQGKEAEYLQKKEFVNSVYGMMVTDIVRDEIVYGADGWEEVKHADMDAEIGRYNSAYNRFLFYPWGVWVTAYARRNLWTGIYEFAEDYIYSDTDSIKVVNEAAHADYLRAYNEQVNQKLLDACMAHKIDFEETRPRTIKGVQKPLGVWDFDGHYKRFKTLGAKRYLVRYSSDKRNDLKRKTSLTVSGLNKKKTVPYMQRTYRTLDNIFDAFSNSLYVPAEHTGKLIHTYIDEETSGTITDYKGRTCTYHELSAVHMEGAEYSLSISQEYLDFIKGLEDMDA